MTSIRRYIPGLRDQYEGLPTTLNEPSQNGFQKFWRKLRNRGEITLEDEEVVTGNPGILDLSRFDRLMLFALAFAASASCFIIDCFLFPVLALKPLKFSLIWTLGSVFFLLSFAFLQGFGPYVNHLFSTERAGFTTVFISSIVFTLVTSVKLHSVILTIVACVVQMLAMVWYVVSYFPFGKHALRLGSTMVSSQAESWMNS